MIQECYNCIQLIIGLFLALMCTMNRKLYFHKAITLITWI